MTFEPFQVEGIIRDSQGRRQVARAVSDDGTTVVVTAGTGDPAQPLHLILTRDGAADLAALLAHGLRLGTPNSV